MPTCMLLFYIHHIHVVNLKLSFTGSLANVHILASSDPSPYWCTSGMDKPFKETSATKTVAKLQRKYLDRRTQV